MREEEAIAVDDHPAKRDDNSERARRSLLAGDEKPCFLRMLEQQGANSVATRTTIWVLSWP